MVDGPTLAWEALAAGLRIEEAFVAPGVAADLAAALHGAGARVHRVSQELLARAADTVTPQGVALIAGRPEVPLERGVEAAAAGPLALVLVDVADPGNAGTLLRAAEASGASAVLFCGASVDPCNPKCVRATGGALFHVPVSLGGQVVTVLQQLREAGVTTAATVVHDGTAYDRTDLTGPLALVLGSEAHGLPPTVLERVEARLTIPMAGRSESLNVAMAGSVLCFEALRQRRARA